MNVTCLNHPETILLSSVKGKANFHETGPWCQKVGSHFSKES